MTNSPKLRVPYALAVHGKEERENVLAVLDEHRTNIGIEVAKFESSVSKSFGTKHGVMVNSGSSANLLALSLLNLPAGSEIITPLLTFSTTISPMVQLGLIPVFIDVLPGTYVIDIDKIESAITKKTKALVIPLLMGNVPDLSRLQKIAKKHSLFLMIDSCDTFAAEYKKKKTGKYADIVTTSFFGSHIITAGGNGGMVLFDSNKWLPRAKMLRGWGRTSSIFSESESIEKRFKYKIGKLPYDAKFIFDEIGYNFLPNEMGAAFGNAQIKKVTIFKKTREKNFKELSKFFSKYLEYFIIPSQSKEAVTQWLAFPLTIKKSAPFSRLELVKYLEKENMQTRPIFTGNILEQPGFKKINHRLATKTFATDEIMERGFVIGCHHGMEQKHLERIYEVFEAFLKRFKNK